jgi:hypothetical protein|nr:MAG TPA: hypothetical protein [Caudoviricetes sp.]
MEPIISPWTIFALSHIETIRALIYILAIIGVAILGTFFKDMTRAPKIAISTITVVLLLVAILLPNKEVLIAMYIANHATPENIQMLINTFIK